MAEEVEVKFLSVDPQKMEEKLKSIGAKREFERLYKRRVFDYPDLRLDSDAAWIRVRDEGDNIMMAFKQRIGVNGHRGENNDKSMEEVEFEVSDFGKACIFLEKIGLKEKFYLENRRIRYKMDDIEFDIDFWPKLKPYLEIEAPNWEKLDEAIKLLGLNPADKKIFSTTQIYALSGIRDKDYRQITFEEMVKKDK